MLVKKVGGQAQTWSKMPKMWRSLQVKQPWETRGVRPYLNHPEKEWAYFLLWNAGGIPKWATVDSYLGTSTFQGRHVVYNPVLLEEIS